MNKYFYAQNSWVDRSIIDDNYKNYSLSRKIYAKDLPIVTVSEADGYLIKGSIQLRKVELQGDEFFVAVGRDFDKDMYHYIFNCFKYDNGLLKIEHFICAAEYVSLYQNARYSPLGWITNDYTEQTGIQYPYSVPDDLCVYIFSLTPRVYNEQFGFQVLKPSGNDLEVVFDSRYKYLNIIGENTTIGNKAKEIIASKKIAIGTTSPVLWASHDFYNNYVMNQSLVVFKPGHVTPAGYVTERQEVCAGARIIHSWSRSEQYVLGGIGEEQLVFVIDVNGF